MCICHLLSPSFYSLCNAALWKLSICWLENSKRRLLKWDNKQAQKEEKSMKVVCPEVIISSWICFNQPGLIALTVVCCPHLWGRTDADLDVALSKAASLCWQCSMFGFVAGLKRPSNSTG